jgi:hypothetical protein
MGLGASLYHTSNSDSNNKRTTTATSAVYYSRFPIITSVNFSYSIVIIQAASPVSLQ